MMTIVWSGACTTSVELARARRDLFPDGVLARLGIVRAHIGNARGLEEIDRRASEVVILAEVDGAEGRCLRGQAGVEDACDVVAVAIRAAQLEQVRDVLEG